MQENNCFITLTYREEKLTWGATRPTLYPKDLQNFFKYLRRDYGPKIRFFACGEYGEQKGRPHYHACIFNHEFTDKILAPEEMQGKCEFPLYISPSLAKLWTHGAHTIGELNFETAAYTARYIMKKNLGPSRELYKIDGYAPEFTRMSRRPGIGTAWYDKYKDDIYNYDKLSLRGGIEVRPPKYYNNKFELENPVEYAIIKERRKKAALLQAEKTNQPSLRDKEEIKLSKIKLLKRTLK